MTRAKPKITDSLYSYGSLVAALRREIARGRDAVERQQAITYWNAGKLIARHLLYHKDRAGYGERVFDRLSETLGIHQGTLYQCVKFYEAYPILHARVKLVWSHYRQLITIKDKRKRRRLERKIQREGLASRQLEREIRSLKGNDGAKTTGPSSAVPVVVSADLPLGRGRLHTYRLDGKEDKILLDLGFNVFWEDLPPAVAKMKSGTMIEIRQGERTAGGYAFKESSAQKKELFSYKARVLKIIDGDTLSVSIRLGFGQRARQKLRLRFIDAPEINTPEGKKARDFIKGVLRSCDFVVIKTYQGDKYDRYLTDLFFLPGEPDAAKVAAAGRFLNQELLSAGLAKRYEE